jgi:hypothetical protein
LSGSKTEGNSHSLDIHAGLMIEFVLFLDILLTKNDISHSTQAADSVFWECFVDFS